MHVKRARPEHNVQSTKARQVFVLLQIPEQKGDLASTRPMPVIAAPPHGLASPSQVVHHCRPVSRLSNSQRRATTIIVPRTGELRRPGRATSVRCRPARAAQRQWGSDAHCATSRPSICPRQHMAVTSGALRPAGTPWRPAATRSAPPTRRWRATGNHSPPAPSPPSRLRWFVGCSLHLFWTSVRDGFA